MDEDGKFYRRKLTIQNYEQEPNSKSNLSVGKIAVVVYRVEAITGVLEKEEILQPPHKERIPDRLSSITPDDAKAGRLTHRVELQKIDDEAEEEAMGNTHRL